MLSSFLNKKGHAVADTKAVVAAAKITFIIIDIIVIMKGVSDIRRITNILEYIIVIRH